MHSSTFVVAVWAALAVTCFGQDMNVTMASVDMSVNTTAAMGGVGDPDPVMTTSAVMGNDTVTTASSPSGNATTPMDTTTPMVNMGNMTDVDNGTVTMPTPDADPITTTTQAVPSSTTEKLNCIKPPQRLQEIFQFTATEEFTKMPENTQILVYEVLAAAEGCKMASFINAETAERIFRMFGELPVRYVYIFTNYLAMSLQNEGIIGPS